MFHFKHIIPLLLVCMTLPIHAQSAVIVSLATVSERVRAQNPELAAARLQIQEAAARGKQSGRLPNPNFETAFEHNSSFEERKLEVGFTQRFPITHRLRHEKTLSAIELRAAEAEVREIERQLTAEARETCVKLLANRQRHNLLQSESALMRQFANTLAESAQQGEASALDAGQAKLNAASLEIQIRELDTEENFYLGTLKPLLGMQQGEALQINGSLPDPEIPNGLVDLSHRPDLQKAELSLQAASQTIALEQSRRYDDVEGGLFASSDRSEDAPEGYDTETMIGLRLKIPLPFWNQNKGAVEEAKIRKTRIENETIALTRKIGIETETARNDMKQWASLAREIQNTHLPLAAEQVQIAESAYRDGQGDIHALLQSKQKHLELSASRINALREFHLAKVRHDAALGNP